jgi:ribonuclease T1
MNPIAFAHRIFISVCFMLCVAPLSLHAKDLVVAPVIDGGAGSIGASQAQIAVADLPREAKQTLTLIRAGGPFPFDKDGTVFGNREKQLPKRSRGYYKEYTVKTPGVRDRGARRLIVGDNPQTTAEIYYTDDHYQTFKRLRE